MVNGKSKSICVAPIIFSLDSIGWLESEGGQAVERERERVEVEGLGQVD